MMREKGLSSTVDFSSASPNSVWATPLALYTPIFAVSRVSGWCAHVLEQHGDNRLIRPRAEYVGAMDRKWVPVRKRGEGGGSSGGGGGRAGGGGGPPGAGRGRKTSTGTPPRPSPAQR